MAESESGAALDEARLEALWADLRRELRRLAHRHGLHPSEGVLRASPYGAFASFGFLSEPAEAFFARLYEAHAEGLGLEADWLGARVFNPSTGRSLRILGLDPEGGRRCVRLEDERGEAAFLTPAVVRRLITEAPERLAGNS